MSSQLPPLKELLEQEACPIHHEHASVIIDKNDISIAACCDTFHEHLERLMEYSAEAVDEITGISQ